MTRVNHSDGLFNKLVLAWRSAAHELGVEVLAPYEVDYNDESIACVAYLPHFGHANGMLVAATSANHAVDQRIVKYAKARELYVSFINPEVYQQYNEERFRDTLIDWGYFGPERDIPSWISDYLT